MSTVPSPAPPKRRLVPDRSDTIEVGGSRLVRAVRAPAAEEAPSPEPRSIDDVVQKHLSREVAEVAEAHPEFWEALAAAEHDAPAPLHDLAGRIELFTDGEEAVPNLEPDAKKREGMTISPVIATDDAPVDFVSPRAAPETLIDLFSLFPGLDGVTQFIYVERKEPKLFGGRKVAGMLRPISGPLSLADWQEIYGGGTYKLIVYGPPKRGGVMGLDGKVAPKALTEPMTVTFPGIPSLEGEVYDDEEAEMTQSMPHGFPGRRPASSADAQVVKTQVEADLEREKRRDSKEDQAREREEKERKDREREQTTVAKQIAEMGRAAADREAEFRRELLELQRQHQSDLQEQRKEFEEKLEKKKPERSELDTALALSKNLQGDPGASSAALEALRADHAREIDRLARLTKEDHERAEERIRSERTRCDGIVKDAEARADARIRESNERTSTLERDLRDRADREMQRVKDEADRRVTDLQHQHTTAMASEARNHDRDLASLKAQHQMALESLKGSYEMRLETARSEVKRTAADVERYKADAEDNKDIVGKVAKLKEEAAMFGLVDASEVGTEPETIGQMLMKMGSGLLTNMPAIIENVSTMVKQRSAQDLQAARQAGRNEMVAAASEGLAAPGLPPAHRRRGLDGGGGWVPRHMSEVGPAPVTPGHDPFVVMPEPEYVAPVPQPQPQYQPVPQQQQVFPGHMAMPPEPQMRPQAAPTPSPAQPQQLGPASPSVPPPPPASPPASMPPAAPPQQSAPAADQAALAEDREILQAEQMLLPPYQNNMTVPLLAEAMVQQVPIETLRGLLQSTDADRVILAISRSGDPNSPFLRRDGKKYLRALFDELKKRLAS